MRMEETLPERNQDALEATSPRLFAVFAAGILLLSLAMGFTGIRWGLPSAERNALYYTTPESRAAAAEQIRAARRVQHSALLTHSSSDVSPVPRSLYNPVRSYHPDEYYVFKMLSEMRLPWAPLRTIGEPWKFEADPGWYVIGGAYVYPLGAVLKSCDLVGLVTLKRDITFYVDHPEEIAKLYLVGRVMDVLLAAATVLLVMLAARRLWGAAAALCAGLVLLTSPLLVMHSHFMYDDLPGTFWAAVAILASCAILEKGERSAYVLAGLAAGLAAGTKLFHGFIIILPIAAHFMRLRDELTNHIHASRKGRLLAMGLLAVGVFFVTNPYFLLRPQAVLQNFSRHVWAGDGFSFYLRAACFGFGVLPLAAAAAGFLAGVVRRNRPAVLIGLWCAAYYIMLSLYGKQFARFLLPAFPAAALLASYLAHLATSAARNRSFVRVFALSAAVLVTLLPQIMTDCGAISSLRGVDSRTLAGQFILSSPRLPAGSTIAVTEEPWQFEMPPFDQSRFKIAVCNYDLARLDKSRPNAFIYSEMQSDPEITSDAEHAGESSFWQGIEQRIRSGNWTMLYESPAAVSEDKFPCAFGLWPTAPEDMRYLTPVVYVLAPAAPAQP
jgi:hypothetical protein